MRWECSVCGHDRFKLVGSNWQHRKCQNPECGTIYSYIPAIWVRRGYPPLIRPERAEEEFYSGIPWPTFDPLPNPDDGESMGMPGFGD